MKIITRQLGPGMVQQMQTACPSCNGTGEFIEPKHRCKACSGKKVVEMKEVIDVCIDKGMKDGEKITFFEKGEVAPGAMSGDLIVVLQEEKDEGFTRKGKDLIYEHQLTLSEALTGYEFLINHLDDRVLVVRSSAEEIVKPDDLRVIEGEGMPIHKSPYEKGKLIIKFSVVFPTPQHIPLANRKKLEALLPPKPKLPKNLGSEAEEVSAREYEPMDYEQQPNQEDDEEGGQRGTQCVHQ